MTITHFCACCFLSRARKAGHKHQKTSCARCSPRALPTDGFVFDTALAAYLLDATAGNYDLPRLAQAYLGGEAPDAQTVWALQPVLREKMDTLGMLPLYTDIELPLCRCWRAMEHDGLSRGRARRCTTSARALTSGIAALQQSDFGLRGRGVQHQLAEAARRGAV